ncbi:Crp/Fnr family transcriptional regulator [Roseovarius sp. M141]|uniref:Crp/Fnr family transcriptional regulator n=1 Tax=Roseovarius sp. M141 TaxID=2583806 RepID=UPI0020CFDC59|nr:Crp/Fnr family transcriptional regulator [Roseovarius sp. M141]MCQ0090876.1 Crp/Fnr family transcriptional regulator [Roseovarius sp. M141]
MSRLPDISKRGTATSVVAEIRSALSKWNVESVSLESQIDIQHEGDRPKAMYLVKSGWIYSYALLADGQRQILFLHQAGDIAGLADFGVERVSCSLRSLGDCVVLPVPITAIATADFLTPEITTYFLRKSAEMQSILMRTLIAVGRMEARHRIVWLILMLHDRIPGSGTRRPIVEIPFNQSEIGDLIGLTNVSVSKMLCQLSDEGYIERKGSKILIRRRADLRSMISYEPMGFSANPFVASGDLRNPGTNITST